MKHARVFLAALCACLLSPVGHASLSEGLPPERGNEDANFEVNAHLDLADEDAQTAEAQARAESVEVASLFNYAPAPSRSENGCRAFRGIASWYGPGFEGHKTASGTRLSGGQFTAAHRTLPLGTNVVVTNLQNGRQVHVLINDRGPYVGGRIIDLTLAAKTAIGMDGTAMVSLSTCL